MQISLYQEFENLTNENIPTKTANRQTDPLSSSFKTSDQVQGQGVPQIENGTYTLVREYFNLRHNAAIEPEMGF